MKIKTKSQNINVMTASICFSCDTSFSSITMSSVERKRLNGRCICQECGIQCSSKSSFYRHTKQHLLNVEDVQEALGMIARNSVCHVSDNGIEWLLRFLFQFFNILSLKVNHGLLTEFIMIFPTSMYMLRKLMTLDRDNFERFVVCRECFTTYRLDDCFNEINGVTKKKLCTHEYFKRNRGYYCNTPLLKEVLLKDGSIKLYPHKVYCFNSLINGLEYIIQKQNLPDLMFHWKSWSNKTNFLRDVYDGAMWRSFGDFFQGLILNVDWFQPFKNRTDYSVGVIYFTILNLPRNIRYIFENVIVVGLIPALKKKPSDLSPFLSPVMKELKALWKGVSLKTSLSSVALTIRAALVCVACDIPAARKVCGFKSHSAVLGCHRCFKNFPAASFGARRNYSGFDRQNWKLRSKQLHNKYARRILITKFKKTEDVVLNFDMSGFDFANNVRAPESYKVSCLDAEDMSFLLNCYQHMYPSKTIQMDNLTRWTVGPNVLANWSGSDGNILIQPDSFGLKPCKIDFYFSHVLDLDGTSIRHFFAKVTWYKEYVERTKYGNNMQIWHYKKYSSVHGSCFVPVQRIRCRCTYGLTGQSNDLMMVSAIPRKVYKRLNV
ncbi:hypothetical protein KUTeg_000593 [Tegillarca granosa]|uniref:C2H2-type domain-containing protein n=1 Tax=Tegillarca granosa TaxID=220873 RepID=A0ABQ9G1E6_TEGGR|nr:hypothetical protein KUTeg_000593 [Tegillarca granosa]